jgi:hypothetical protein
MIVGWFCAFGEHLPEEFFEQLAAQARQLHDKPERAAALVHVAARFGGKIPGIEREAVEAAQTLAEPALRAELLAQLAAVLPPDLVDLALVEGKEIVSPPKRVSALAALAGRLDTPRKTETLRRVLVAVRDSRNEQSALAHRVFLRIIPELPQELLGEALTTALSLDDLAQRRLGLKELGRRYPPAFIEALVLAGDDMAERAGACATQLDDSQRITAWTRLLHRLATDSRETAVEKIGATASILHSLAGEAAVQATYESVQRVGAWWP